MCNAQLIRIAWNCWLWWWIDVGTGVDWDRIVGEGVDCDRIVAHWWFWCCWGRIDVIVVLSFTEFFMVLLHELELWYIYFCQINKIYDCFWFNFLFEWIFFWISSIDVNFICLSVEFIKFLINLLQALLWSFGFLHSEIKWSGKKLLQK